MTLDDLLETFRNHPTTREGVKAVVEALRDELRREWFLDDSGLEAVERWMNEILASDGVEAEGYTGGMNDLNVTPAAASDVCEWTPYIDEPLGSNWWRTCSGVRHRYTFDGHHPCASCGKLISFKSEAAR